METTKARPVPFPYETVAGVGLIIMAVRPLATMVLDQRFIAMGLIFVAIPLALLGLVLTRNRWLMVIVVAVSAALLYGGFVSPIVRARLADPAAFGYFTLELADLVANAVVVVTGLGFLAQSFAAANGHN